MHNFRRIGIGILVGVFFATGFLVREGVNERERAALEARNQETDFSLGTRIASLGLQGAGNVDFRPLQTLVDVVANLRQYYVEQLTAKDEGRMTHEALRSMLASLEDPDTRFVEAEERKIIEDMRECKFHGIGAVLAVVPVKSSEYTEEHLFVVSTIPGGPAEAAGLKTGDDIRKINGNAVLPFDPYQQVNTWIKDARNGRVERSELQKLLKQEEERIENGIPVLEAQEKLASEEGKPLELTIAREGVKEELKLKVKPKEFSVDPITASLFENGAYGYIKINCFAKSTGERFTQALSEFKSADVAGLVLDLRGLAGGETKSLLEVARSLMPGKTIATLQKSRDRKVVVKAPVTDDINWNKPVVVLVDGGTARMGEVLASGLQSAGVAKLVGERTYGDPKYVILIDQRDGTAVMMTAGLFLSPTGEDYSGKGLPVDIEVASSPSGDIQLDTALGLLKSSEAGS